MSKKFKQNFYFIKILSLGFNLGCLKMNTCLKKVDDKSLLATLKKNIHDCLNVKY